MPMRIKDQFFKKINKKKINRKNERQLIAIATTAIESRNDLRKF